MGNCLKCFQTSSTTSANASEQLSQQQNLQQQQLQQQNDARTLPEIRTTFEARTAGVIGATKLINERSQETDELLSPRSPLKTGNHCDSKRNSFKKSLVLLNNGNGSAGITEIIATVKESMEVSDNTLNQLFEEYKDSEDMILTDGIERLCHDLDYQPDEFAILVLAWCLDASQMCRFTKVEFIEGLHKMCADSIETIRIRLEQTIKMLEVDSEMFKQLYRFTFRFGLEPDQRILSLDMAICLWKLVFTVHTPDLIDNWIHFLEQHPSIRGIPKDTWNMFLNFAEQCDIDNYDDTEAWPSLFDDFVDYEKQRLATVHADAAQQQQQQDDDNNNDEQSRSKLAL